jgi:hypothetical protein
LHLHRGGELSVLDHRRRKNRLISRQI